MSQSPGHPPRHVYIFWMSLLALVIALCLFLFGVDMEAIRRGQGTMTSTAILPIYASRSGIVQFPEARDNGLGGQLVSGSFLEGGARLLNIMDHDRAFPEMVPNNKFSWQLLELLVVNGQRVRQDDKIAVLVAYDKSHLKIRELCARIEIEEKQFGSVRPGQSVRLNSPIFPSRSFGYASGLVNRIDPIPIVAPGGIRKFVVWVDITESPFELPLESTIHADIIIGKQSVYQIILDH